MDPRIPRVSRAGLLFISIALLSLVLFLPSAADGQDQRARTDPKTFVLLLHRECDYQMRDSFDYYMRLNNTEYEKFLGDYDVVCLGGVGELDEIEQSVLPILRSIFESDTFIFVYPESMEHQYQDHMETKYGSEYRYASLGYSDILLGIGYAMESPANVKHEMAHLSTCGTWHDADGNNLGSLFRHPLADGLAWCQLYD